MRGGLLSAAGHLLSNRQHRDPELDKTVLSARSMVLQHVAQGVRELQRSKETYKGMGYYHKGGSWLIPSWIPNSVIELIISDVSDKITPEFRMILTTVDTNYTLFSFQIATFREPVSAGINTRGFFTMLETRLTEIYQRPDSTEDFINEMDFSVHFQKRAVFM